MAVWRDRRAALGLALIARRFPPPWSVDELEECFVVHDSNGQVMGIAGP